MRRGADKIAPGGRSSLLGVHALLHRGDSATASAMASAMALPIPRDAPTICDCMYLREAKDGSMESNNLSTHLLLLLEICVHGLP
jgi:hypothetical protein